MEGASVYKGRNSDGSQIDPRRPTARTEDGTLNLTRSFTGPSADQENLNAEQSRL
jgi:hypothetical protein